MKLGFEKDKVVINGPYKGFNALRDTLEDGAIVNLDYFFMKFNGLKITSH